MSDGGQPQNDDALIRRIAALRKAGATDDEVAQIIHEHDNAADFSGVQGGSSTTATPPGRLGATAYGALQGASLGFADEAIAGAFSPVGEGSIPENYVRRRDAMRNYGHAAQSAHPGYYTAGEIGGALAPVVLSGGAASAEAAPSLVRATLGAAKSGAIMGGVAGFGGAEGSAGQQALQTGIGVGLGGAFGAATPAVARGATGLYRALTEKAGDKATRIAGEQIIAGLQRDGYTLDEAKRIVLELSRAGAGNKPAAAIDLPNAENVRGMARGIHSQPGPGRQEIQGFTDSRQAGQAARLQRDFTATSGTPAGSPSLEREAVLRARRAADAANYGKSVDAMGDTPITDPELLSYIEDQPSLRAARVPSARAEEERIGTAAFKARQAAPEVPSTEVVPAAAPEVVPAAKPAKSYRYDSMRRPDGDVRDLDQVKHVSDDGLFNELVDLTEKADDAKRRSQYRSTFDDDQQIQRTVATRHGGGPSEQAKALKNLDNYLNRQDAIETELRRRGHTNETITDRMFELSNPEAAAERQAMQSESNATDFDFGANAERPAATQAAASSGAPANGITARELQRMDQALGKAIRGAKLSNPLADGGAHSDAYTLGQTRDRFKQLVNRNVPGLEAANQSSAAGLGQAKAITLGARLFNKSPDVVGAEYRALRTDAERAAFRRAYGQKYLEAIGGGRGSSDRAGTVFGTTGTVAGSETKLAQARAAFEDDATFQRFIGALEAEGKMTVGNRVVGNSNTASKLADQADLRRHPLIKAGLAAGNMKFGEAAKALLAGGLEARSARLSEGSRGELAKILTADPMTLAEYLDAAAGRGRRSTANGKYLARLLGAEIGLTEVGQGASR